MYTGTLYKMMENGGDKEDNKVYVYVMSYFDHNIIIFIKRQSHVTASASDFNEYHLYMCNSSLLQEVE